MCGQRIGRLSTIYRVGLHGQEQSKMLYTLFPRWERLSQTRLSITLPTGPVFMSQTAVFCPIVEGMNLDYSWEKKMAETGIFEYAQYRHLCRG